MNVLLNLYRDSSVKEDLIQVVDQFIASNEAKGMLWWGDGEPKIFVTVQPYLHKRLQQAANTGDYVRF